MYESRIVTLTTDFGLSDHFVGVMKGVILGVNPEARLVDLSHDIAAFDVLDGAYTIAQSYRFFPPGSVHLVVVDPGVGSARKPILAVTPTARFVAPDNGVLSMVYRLEPQVEIREIDVDRYALKPASSTFHGRDIFAPVAGWLSRGVPASEFGPVVADCVCVAIPQPFRSGERKVEGTILKVDHFGNLITNLTAEDLPEMFAAPPRAFRITVGDKSDHASPCAIAIRTLVRSFSEGKTAEPFAILGSSGFLEIGINQGSAAALGAKRNSRVTVEFKD